MFRAGPLAVENTEENVCSSWCNLCYNLRYYYTEGGKQAVTLRGSSALDGLGAAWVHIWSVIHSGSRRVGEAAVPGPDGQAGVKPLKWAQANVTGTCNIECVLELGADITLLTEPRCSGEALGKECKRKNLACTGRGSAIERLAAVVFDPKIASEVWAELDKWPHWEARVAGIRVKMGPRSAAVV